ncbi:uncharacterized protein LOC119685343 [Teleopsis dalmanni]|uniref:uncharacterized protein LOC119685343 n=1 Tax=Teleopsis dalmanni TaxID=139649 RepID=UPI0018CE8D0C|nr:uncharacterized protein LOC119685343 [Teleopsis dalmanni]
MGVSLVDSIDLSNTFLENLQKLINQTPITDVETTDDEEEYIEYVYRPRQYFSVSLCNYCKCDLNGQMLHECKRCRMVFYCNPEHMKSDEQHRQCCYALRQVAENCGGYIFYKCDVFTMDQFRSYRIVTVRQVESIINRTLTPTEREIVLFPRICTNNKCREYRFSKLMDCKKCGQVAFCKDKPDHLKADHILWCEPFRLFKKLIIFQEKYGRLEPTLPSKVLKDLPGAVSNTQHMFFKLNLDIKESCEYAVLSQIATGPLTAWYALKLCEQLKSNEEVTIHLIGAEIEFEVDTLHKWELFFLHITPHVKILNIVFIGPELKQTNISFEQLQKTKCCRVCRKNGRELNYYFENIVYHDYRKGKTFSQPNLICFFNAGLYRSTGFQMEDSWPETIDAAVNLKCPIIVTSYTAYESPLDMKQILQDSGRCLNIILPPTINPFASTKPERNFISEEDAPLIFKNYYCFVVE